MLSFELAQVPSFMNNMAGGALKRISAAVGYNMTCSSQEEVSKQLPETQSEQAQQPLLERTAADNQSPNKALSTISEAMQEDTPKKTVMPLQKSLQEKENTQIITTSQPKLPPTYRRTGGKVSMRTYYRSRNLAERKKNRREILNKIRAGQERRQSWRPDQILKNRWKQMSPQQRKELIQKAGRLVTTGAIKTYNWLTWNIPKYSIKVMYLVISGEAPEYANDALKMCDLIRDLDRL